MRLRRRSQTGLHADRPLASGPHAVPATCPPPRGRRRQLALSRLAVSASTGPSAWEPGAVVASECSPAGGTRSLGPKASAQPPPRPPSPGLWPPHRACGASAGRRPSGHLRSGGSPSKGSCLSPVCPTTGCAATPLPHSPVTLGLPVCLIVLLLRKQAWTPLCPGPRPAPACSSPTPCHSAREPFGHTGFCTTAVPEPGHLHTCPVMSQVLSGWAAAGGRSQPGLAPSGPPAASLVAPCPRGSAGVQPSRAVTSPWPHMRSAAGAAEPAGWTPHPAHRHGGG